LTVLTTGARFTVLAQQCVRIELCAAGRWVDAPSLFAVVRDTGFSDYTVDRDGDAVRITTASIELSYRPGALSAEILDDGSRYATWTPGAANPGNLGGTLRTLDSIKAAVGTGDGLLSRDGWALIDDSNTPLMVDGWVADRPADCGADWYLFGYGADYRAALSAFTAVSGRAPLPRRYTFGSWFSRYWPLSSADYRRIVAEYREHDFPLDILVLDMDWHGEGWTGWSWNRELLPDAEALLAELHEEGLFATLNLHPANGVAPHEDRYEAFSDAVGAVAGEVVPFDAGNRTYMEALFEQVLAPLEDEGVDFWWLDWQQYPFTRSIATLTNLRWLNHLFFQHTGRAGQRGLSFSRWAGWGDHRHPIHFSGDADTGWPMLKFEVAFNTMAGNVGCFFWSHDIGGHLGLRNEEAFVRWVWFGATTASLRVHSTRDARLERRPWAYGEQAESAMRAAFHLRSELMPTVYSAAWQCHAQSVPLARPMYLDHSDEPEAYRSGGQFMFGDDLLVAPVVARGYGKDRVGFQSVWFPAGRWFNWFTGERFDGPGRYVVAAAIDETPLYVRGGAPIVLQPYTERMTTTPLTTLRVRVWPGGSGETVLYEDDGLSTGYLTGSCATTRITATRDGDQVTIEVAPTEGDYDGQLLERALIIELPGTSHPPLTVAAADIRERARVQVTAPEVPADAPERAANLTRASTIWATRGIAALAQDGDVVVYGDRAMEVVIDDGGEVQRHACSPTLGAPCRFAVRGTDPQVQVTFDDGGAPAFITGVRL